MATSLAPSRHECGRVSRRQTRHRQATEREWACVEGLGIQIELRTSSHSVFREGICRVGRWRGQRDPQTGHFAGRKWGRLWLAWHLLYEWEECNP